MELSNDTFFLCMQNDYSKVSFKNDEDVDVKVDLDK